MQIPAGPLKKMTAQLSEQGNVNYQLPIGDNALPLNDVIGHHLTLTFQQHITCQHCGRKTKKSYSQGFCFPCMQKLAQCDMCIMKPETCHFHLGTCREPEWGERNCFMPHYVYLANTSGVKVGITRETQIPTRWIDQGATQALPIFKVSSRLQSGLVEIALAQHIADKTNWRAMLKGETKNVDLQQVAQELKPLIRDKLAELQLNYGEDAIEELEHSVVDLSFPVTQYPTKVSSFNFDKHQEVSGILQGIKGQYLIFDTGVINIRKFTSYHVEAKVE
ncbi:DUF2797 domain-containing protein [Thalassotalea sp. 1_MG-2023]|uniref:DUF2797 domain-containing protein n=1 Tax=Thalassotalea sp. 1_MG-2023 TaxID=3062680 RepID=UPI0026E1CC28|nr:DUF2797 domain-containing protein [Thalassotalea sp. 1_MG-2023]MDO6427105.1 DUF2797 domain-containing protein [Thalassotalea sp. 1_MG-2023]